MDSSDAPSEAQVTAAKKYSCPSCGGEAVWNPSKQALVCPYCGTEVAGQGPSGEIVEHDLTAALRAIPDEARGWDSDSTSVRCQHCNAISVFNSVRVAQRCDFCGSSSLIPYSETKAPFRPESVLPKQISENQARDILRTWLGKVWFAPNNLSRISRTDQLTGCYLPFWTFDAHVDASWTAESGYYYYTTESYTDSQGNRKSRSVRHTRWERSSGSLSHFFDDELVCASKGVPATLIDRVKPFPTKDLVPYASTYVSGWVVEQYQIDLVSAGTQSRDRMQYEVEAMCAKQVPGDTYRSLRVTPQFSAQTFKHILAPVWIVSFLYRQKSYQVIVNGVTGAVHGFYPKSWVKIFLAVVAAIAVGLLILSLVGESKGSTTFNGYISFE